MIKLDHITTRAQLKRYYASLLPIIRELAREHGYAIGVHGSMSRDLDVIAVPWVEKPKKPESLIIAIEKAIIGASHMRKYWKETVSNKPLGRKAYSIHIGWTGRNFTKTGTKRYKGMAYIDISFTPAYE